MNVPSVASSPAKGADLFSEVGLLESRRETILGVYGSSSNCGELQAELADIDATLQKYYSFASDVTWSKYA